MISSVAQRRRWWVHLGLLVLVAVATCATVGLIDPGARRVATGPGALLDVVVGFAEGLDVLGLILGTLSAGLGYAVLSTVVLFVLRSRRWALLCAHAPCAIAVAVAVWSVRAQRAEKLRARKTQWAQEDEGIRALEREEQRARERAERGCLRVRLVGTRVVPKPGAPGVIAEPPRIALELRFSCEQTEDASRQDVIDVPLSGVRLRAKGSDFELALEERSYFPPRRFFIDHLPIGGVRSAATDEAFEAASFTLEVRFAGADGWTSQPLIDVECCLNVSAP